MKEKITEKEIETSLKLLKEKIAQKIKKFGYRPCASKHETLGFITEEYHELIEAVHLNKEYEVLSELFDIATACMHGIATMYVPLKDLIQEYQSLTQKIKQHPLAISSKKLSKDLKKLTKKHDDLREYLLDHVDLYKDDKNYETVKNWQVAFNEIPPAGDAEKMEHYLKMEEHLFKING